MAKAAKASPIGWDFKYLTGFLRSKPAFDARRALAMWPQRREGCCCAEIVGSVRFGALFFAT